MDLKIAFILPSLANKGPVLVCRDIIANIIDQVSLCEVYYFDQVQEVEFPCKTIKINFFSNYDFGKFNIVHSHMFRPDLYLWFRNWTSVKKYKTVTTIHTAILDDLKFAYSKIRTKLLPPLWAKAWASFDQVVVLTNTAASYYSYLGIDLKVLGNGRCVDHQPVEQSDYDYIIEIKKKYKVIGTVCSFDERKGLQQVVEALKDLKDYCFVIVGDGSVHIKNKLIETANFIGAQDRLFFLGTRYQGNRFMPLFDVFAIPSFSEGFPLALLEAAAHQVPIVCSDLPVFKEIFSENEVVFFQLGDIRKLVEAVELAFVQGNQRTTLAFRKYQEQYTPEIMGENYMKLYRDLIDKYD